MRLIKHPPALFYSMLRRVPTRAQKLVLYLSAPKLTLGASAVILDEQGCVLLLHHTYRRPGWDLPSGMVGHNEQPAMALARELREELDVSATVGTLLHAEVYPSTRHLTLYYHVAIQGMPRHDGREIDASRYVSADELVALTEDSPAPAWLLQAQQLQGSTLA